MSKKSKELKALCKIVKTSVKAGASIRIKKVHVRNDGTIEYRMFIDFGQTALNVWTDDTEIISMLNVTANQKAR